MNAQRAGRKARSHKKKIVPTKKTTIYISPLVWPLFSVGWIRRVARTSTELTVRSKTKREMSTPDHPNLDPNRAPYPNELT